MDHMSLKKIIRVLVMVNRLPNVDGNPVYEFTMSDGTTYRTGKNIMGAYKGPPPIGAEVTMVADKFKQIANYGWAESPLLGYGEDIK